MCVGATTTVIKPTTIDTMSTAAKSDMSSRVKSMRENTKETQDDTPLVVHNPVDDENAPPDRGEQFGPHRRGMPAAPTTHPCAVVGRVCTKPALLMHA